MSTINCLSLHFRKNITFLNDGLLKIGQIIALACITVYRWITANYWFMSGINDQEIVKIIGTFEQHAKHEFNCRWKIVCSTKPRTTFAITREGYSLQTNDVHLLYLNVTSFGHSVIRNILAPTFVSS